MDGRQDELERLGALVAAIPDPIYRVRADGTFVSVEVPDDHPTAVPQETIPGLNIRTAMPERQANLVMEGIAEALSSGGMVAVEYDLVVAGERRFWEARIVPAGGDVYAIVREITERRLREHEALRRARTDPLTGLANRSALHERLEQALARCRRSGAAATVMFADLDRFKEVNDSHGHSVGDAVLAEAATRVAGLIRDVDLAARVGGDEIAVVLEDVDRDEAEAIADRLVASVSAAYLVDGLEHSIGLSIGVAVFPDDGDGPDALLAAADAAMYAAKQGGGTQVAWASEDSTG